MFMNTLWQEWGIKSFKDKKSLSGHIEKLIVQFSVSGIESHRLAVREAIPYGTKSAP